MRTTNLPILPDYPNQARLEQIVESNMTQEYMDKALSWARETGRTKGVDKILKDYDIDVIIGPAESDMPLVSSASGMGLFPSRH